MKGTHELGWICLWLLSVSLLGGMGCAYAQTEAEMMADRTETTVTSQWTFEDAKTACPYDAARNMLLYPVVEGQAFPLLSDLHFFDDGGAPISVMALDSQGQSLRAEEAVSALLYTQAAYARVNLAVTTLPVLTLTHIGETTVSYQLIDPNHVKHDMQWMSSGVASLEVRGKDPGKMGKRTYDLRLKVRDGANAEKENHRFLGMRNDNHWVLEGMDNDRALLREKLSGDLWNQINEHEDLPYHNNNMKSRYVEVFLDGDYRGLYLMREPVDRKQVDIARQEAERSGVLIEAAFSGQDVWTTPVQGPQKDEWNAHKMQYPKNLEDYTPYWEIFRKQWCGYLDYAKNPDERMMRFTFYPENLVDYWLFVNMTGSVDGVNEMYLSMNDDRTDQRLLITPWDMNNTWGRDGARHMLSAQQPLDPLHIEALLLDTDAFGMRTLLLERWQTLQETVLNVDYIGRELESRYAQTVLSGAASRDAMRWGANDAETTKDVIFTWMVERLAWMDTYLSQWSNP